MSDIRVHFMINKFIQNGIARAWQIAQNPNMVVCIERGSCADKANGERILSLIRAAQKRADQSLVLVTPEAVFVGFADAREAQPQTELEEEAEDEAVLTVS